LGAGAHIVLFLFLVLINRRDVVNEAVALLARTLVVVALVILLILRTYQPMQKAAALFVVAGAPLLSPRSEQ